MRSRKVFFAILFTAFFLFLSVWLKEFFSFGVCNSDWFFSGFLWQPVILFCSVVILGIFVFLWWREKDFGWPWIMLFSGGLSNAIEYIRFGCIIDYFSIPYFPLFNGADVLLTVGTGLLFWQWYKQK